MSSTHPYGYRRVVPIVLSTMMLHACSGGSGSGLTDSQAEALPDTLILDDTESDSSAPIINVSESTETIVPETDIVNVGPVDDDQPDGGDVEVVETETETETMIVLEAQPDGAMLFLAPLGRAPLANLPLVNYDLFSQDVRFSPDEILPESFDGCLLARFGVFYCYQPENRILRSVLGDGTPFWSFPLPGDNGTNRVEAVTITAFGELGLIANVTTEFGSPKHEASFFNSQGAFDRTLDIFKINDTVWPTINLQGEPLEVTDVTQGNLNNNQRFPLRIVGNTYELTPGGNLADPSDWEQSGIMRAVIDTTTGNYLEVELCEGAIVSVGDGRVGMELCENAPDDSPLAVRNNGQQNLKNSFNNVTDPAMRLAAELPTLFRDTFAAAGLATDLQCDPLSGDIDCLRLELPNVGDQLTSSVATMQCPEVSFNSETLAFDFGTAQWSQQIRRTTSDQIELLDIMAFTERCELTGVSGQLTGTVTLVTTVDSDSGEVIDRETRFEDLGGVVGFDYRRFIEGSYRDASDDSKIRYELSAQQIDVGGVCSRSCAPEISTFGHFTDLQLDSSRDRNGAGNFTHSYSAQWVQTRGSQNNPFLGVPETLTADVVYTAAGSTTSNGILEGFVELIQADGAQVRMQPTTELNFPSLPFVQYNAMAPTGESFTWSLPVDAFLRGNIISSRGL